MWTDPGVRGTGPSSFQIDHQDGDVRRGHAGDPGRLPQIQGFYCQGGLDYEHMGRVDRAMMAALRASLGRSPERAEMLEYISRSFDGSDRAYLAPVIAWAGSV